MKFMKLGSRPDTFYTAEAVRSVTSEVSSDLIIQVKGSRYLLHKFPLLSKCLLLQKLCSKSPESTQLQLVQLSDFPSPVEAFELCAKFCYGITITLSAYSIVSTRCAAEYLQMTDDVERGNLISKLEIFFNSCILNGWRDTIITLQSTKGFPSLSEDLGITGRCIEAIASKVVSNPSKESYSRRGRDESATSKGWWGEDLAEMGIDHYWRTMIAIKSCGKVPCNLIGDALRIYTTRWLPPDVSRCTVIEKHGDRSDCEVDSVKHRLMLESIVSLLPSEKNAVPCSFLMELLKIANILKASSSSKTELARRVGLQLEEATVGDLLVPHLSPSSKNGTIYDVDIIITVLEQFMLQGQSLPTSPPRNKPNLEKRRRSQTAENVDFELQESRRSSSASHSSKLKVAKIVDGYLQEIAKDKNLSLAKFIAIAEAIPEFARLDNEDLYKAIDIYLKEHPDLNKIERKRLCQILDCKKLSLEACMHAAQNEMLPLRVVVQVLFFEQARASMASGQVTELPSNIKVLLAGRKTPSKPTATNATISSEDQWSVSGLKSSKSSLSTLKMKLTEDDELDDGKDGVEKSSKLEYLRRPKRIFSKIWTINRSASEKN